MDEDTMGQVFLPVLRYSPVISFHQYSLLIFIYTLLVPQRQEVESWEPANTVMLFRIPKNTGHIRIYFRVIIYKIFIS
jgi:hypothetical protein